MDGSNFHLGIHRIQQRVEWGFHYRIVDEQARASANYPSKQILGAIVSKLSAEEKFTTRVNPVGDSCMVKWRGSDVIVKIAAIGEAGGTSYIQTHASFDMGNFSTFTWSIREYDDELVGDICGAVRMLFFAAALSETPASPNGEGVVTAQEDR